MVMFGGFVNSIYIVITCTGTACWSFMIFFFFLVAFEMNFSALKLCLGGVSGRHITHPNSCLLIAIHFLNLANKTKTQKTIAHVVYGMKSMKCVTSTIHPLLFW